MIRMVEKPQFACYLDELCLYYYYKVYQPPLSFIHSLIHSVRPSVRQANKERKLSVARPFLPPDTPTQVVLPSIEAIGIALHRGDHAEQTSSLFIPIPES